MYTHNIVQKLKKWNDGQLKYFKFNNKAQIFNQDSILITQQFLQNDKQLQESNWGNEFKVGGVLIIIDSMISESERDLTKVFKKKGTATPKAKIIYSKPQIPSSERMTRTPLKEAERNMKRRRVGLSKSLTPSRRIQGTTNQTPVRDELAIISPSNQEIYESDDHITKKGSNNKKLVSKAGSAFHQPENNHSVPIGPGEAVPIIHRKLSKRDALAKDSTTLRTPISVSKGKMSELDELLHLKTPALISSDKYLLLKPTSRTPTKADQINWDEDTMSKTNAKIQDSLKTLVTPKPTPRPIKRITNDRNKREFIKVSKPRISCSTLLSHDDSKKTPSKSRVEVYASDDSEYDEIKSQSQEVAEDMGKITQTETYNYGGKYDKGLKVSDISNL